MKRKWKHPSEPEASRSHWRSLGELEDSNEFKGWLEREFPQGAAEMEADDTSRRQFVKLMGASTALAGFGVACKRPVKHLVPYNEHVEWVVPGRALYYSTVKPALGGLGCEPLVATTHEGRPTKVDGNRLHPDVTGGSSAYTQASILELYDQDRSRGYLKGGAEVPGSSFESEFLAPFREAKDGSGVAILVSPSTSPTRNRLLAQVKKAYKGLRAYSYEALASAGRAEASAELYGAGALPVVNLSGAKRILSLDCDFVGNDPVGTDSVAEFSATRDPDGEMSRLYVAESAFTLTGGQADHRYRIAASQMVAVAALVAKEVAALAGDADLKALAASLASKVVPEVYNAKWIKECAADLFSAKSGSIVLAGGRQPKEVHLIVAAINKVLGSYGSLISVVDHQLPALPGIKQLSAAIKKGEVKTLIVLNEGDVAFDAPSDLKFSELLKGVDTLVQCAYRPNQTTKLASWHVPGAHYLESWGDNRSLSGVYAVQQPMIQPLWGGVSENQFLLSLLKAEVSSASVLAEVEKSFQAAGGEDWAVALRDGYLPGHVLPVLAFDATVSLDAPSVKVADLPHAESVEVLLTVGSATYDGRFANNGWLQEAPDPITKLTWDNAALMSSATASEMGLEDGEMIEITVGDRRVSAPVLRSPGHAEFSISLALGYYGEAGEGVVSEGAGFNAYPLMTTAQDYVVTGALVRSLGYQHDLALTAEHYSMEGRAIAREGTVEMYEEEKDFAGHQGMDHHIPENVSLYKGPDYAAGENPDQSLVPVLDGHNFRVDPHHQWAMTVDLNTCSGCNACVIACQAENNIPIVGKHQVMAGREMHWIRMDRYFTSPKDSEIVADRGSALDYITGAESTKEEPGKRTVDDDHVEMISQPVACQQCESAPCETVCPVNATVHTSDGLNAMTYNRCIGTRYCANNCPYKARRFNYFDYNKRPLDKLYHGPLAPASGNATTTQRLQKNPNVTVRMRGVIEKCTYCVQRISAAKIAAKAAARDSKDVQVKANSLTVACQDACGAGAITFGNLKAKGDKINAAKKNPRNYDLLKYIGTIPRTSYLARIKNPNSRMPGAEKVGTVTSKMH
ncbi:MAG: TAT-variant-translocated molybdopterin oxidoreductase [Verrucomicrobiales bacterium]|nr:TAT-variant-translocated molybdopterin oxidoreductase [Verrucomicrobiales bacterium]